MKKLENAGDCEVVDGWLEGIKKHAPMQNVLDGWCNVLVRRAERAMGCAKWEAAAKVMDALMASVLDFNRCLLMKNYEKSSLNRNPIAMTTCS